MIAVAFGGVDQVDAEAAGAVEDLIDRVLRHHAPFAAELPGAEADDGNDQVSVAESAVLRIPTVGASLAACGPEFGFGSRCLCHQT